MKILKIALLILGLWTIFSGLLFAAQGSGVFPYPRESFMISQVGWVYRGLGIAAVGVVVVWVSRRIRT
jgi:hypothetical protein